MSTRRTPSVLVMAKPPRAGTVKTRLHPLLGPDGCAALQAELIRHTLAMTASHGTRTYLAYAPTGTGAGAGAGAADNGPAPAPPAVRRKSVV